MLVLTKLPKESILWLQLISFTTTTLTPVVISVDSPIGSMTLLLPVIQPFNIGSIEQSIMCTLQKPSGCVLEGSGFFS